ncbi:MAG: hypothetical protein IT332_13085 [Ardenticatenales bacterium]|nr:hypothetical protein [Ardenticatenales bacterium]
MMGLDFLPGDTIGILPHHHVQMRITDPNQLCPSGLGVVLRTMVDGRLESSEHQPLPSLEIQAGVLEAFAEMVRHGMRRTLADLAEVKCLKCDYYERYLKVEGHGGAAPECVRDAVYPEGVGKDV